MAKDWLKYKVQDSTSKKNWMKYKVPEEQSSTSDGFLSTLHNEIIQLHVLTPHERAMQGIEAFNKGFERYTGLPYAARGLAQAGQNIMRGFGNLIPGVNIPEVQFPPIRKGEVENPLQQGMQLGGEALGYLNPANTLYEAGAGALKYIPKIPEYAKRILAGSATGSILSPENRGTGAFLGGGLSSIPEIGSALKKGYKTYQEPYEMLRKAEKELADINRARQRSSSSIKKSEQEIGRHLNTENEAHLLEQQKLDAKLADVYPIKPKSETREALVDKSEGAIKSLGREFQDLYGGFSKEHGHKTIKNTLPFEVFLQKTKNLKGLSSTMQEIIKNPAKKIVRYEDSKGQLKEIPIPGKGATVDDYISFMREVRDASYDAKKASKNATYGEKQELLKTHGELKSLQDDIENRIEQTIGKHNFEPFRKIQEHYASTFGRVKSEPSLANAVYGKKISDALFSDLNQPANKEIRKYLYSQPGYKQALNEHLLQGSQHPISEGAQFNPAKINQDIYHLLSNEQRAAKAEANILGQKQQSLKDVSKSIKTPEKMTALQESEARKFSPEVNSFLDKVAKEKNITEAMERKAQQLGLDKEKFQEQIFKRRLFGAALGAATAIGAVPPVAKKLYQALLG